MATGQTWSTALAPETAFFAATAPCMYRWGYPADVVSLRGELASAR